MDHIHHIIDAFRNELEAVAPVDSWQVHGPIGNSRKCDIYILSSSHTINKLAVKVYRPHAVSDRAPRAQYEALVRTHETLACPKPYGFHAATSAILMEWIEAPRLNKVLWQKTLSPKQRLQLVTKTGIWLRKLHELSDPKPEAVEVEKLRAKLLTQLEKHEAAASRLTHNAAFQTAFHAFEQIGLKGAAPIPHTLLHGDFTPSNLLVKGTDVVGIDIWGARHGPIYEDIARLLTYLSVVSPFALTRDNRRLLKAFQAGYGNDWLDVNSKNWCVILMYQLLRRWIVYQEHAIKGKHGLLSKWFLSRAQKTTSRTNSWLDQWNEQA